MIRRLFALAAFALASLAGASAFAQSPLQWNYAWDANGNGWARYPGGVTVGSPTGGALGIGMINAKGLFVDGVAVGGGSAGGSNGQLQYNNSGAFGGFTLAGDCTFAVPNITCLKTNGTNFGTAATQNTGTSGANVPLLSTANLWGAAQRSPQQTVAISTSTFTPNFDTGQDFTINLTAACPCTLANPSTTPVAGQKGVIYVVQDAGGSRVLNFSGSMYLASGGVATLTQSTAANSIDVYSYVVKSATQIVVSQGAAGATH